MGGRRTLLAAVVGAVLVAGCGHDSTAGRDCSGGVVDGDHCVPYSAGEKVAQEVAQWLLPPFDAPPLTAVTCRVTRQLATCDGTRNDGKQVRVRFTIHADGSLAPLCVSPEHPHPPPNIFCAL